MDIQRLRNLTTGRVHTDMGCIYEDLEMLIGQEGLMTHMLPRAMGAVEPWLREHIKDPKFWDGEYDPTHTGNFDLPTPTKEDQKIFFERFKEMLSPLDSKPVIDVDISPSLND